MEERVIYNVLWIEDKEENVASAKVRAKKYDLNLIWFSNWEDAEIELKSNFEDYSAIILDANCKINREGLETGRFIPVILPHLTELFTLKQKYMPWYILSAGMMEDFDFVMDVAGISRADFKRDWGDMIFFKYAPMGSPQNIEFLFRQIYVTAKKGTVNSIIYRHRDVFKYLGRGNLIDFPEARDRMLYMLNALYFPEKNPNFKYDGNQLRKVLEFLFRAARSKGLLPEVCFEKDKVNLSKCFKFMVGETIAFPRKVNVRKVRWGRAGEGENGSGGDYIFDSEAKVYLDNILKYSTKNSHTDEKEPYLVGEETKELFFGLVLQMCYIIRWFGKYVKEHPDMDLIRRMHNSWLESR